MKNYFTLALVLIVLPALGVMYYFVQFGAEVDKVFLSISTFLFSIFTGFFISRQASRFNRVRETVTKFDGLLSGIYRSGKHINKEFEAGAGEIIIAHYDKVFQTGKWNIHFLEKSSTLKSLHELLERSVEEDKVTKLSNQSLGAVVKALASCQDVRKQMVALYKERVPFDQWVLIFFFSGILIGTVSTMNSVGLLFPSILKAAFVVSILSVLFILYRLNNLVYTERIMGEESAKDVVGIIHGTK